MRLFLCAELPDGLRRELTVWIADLESRMTGWRWLNAHSIHLTLRFLGEVEPDMERRSREGWKRAASSAEPFRLCLTELGCVPPRGNPRVLWVGVEETRPGGVLVALARRVELAASEQGWKPERRPFRPHLTLARQRGRTRRPSASPEARPPEGAEGWVRRMTLMQSHLEPSGARYTALASYPLGREGVTDD